MPHRNLGRYDPPGHVELSPGVHATVHTEKPDAWNKWQLPLAQSEPVLHRSYVEPSHAAPLPWLPNMQSAGSPGLQMPMLLHVAPLALPLPPLPPLPSISGGSGVSPPHAAIADRRATIKGKTRMVKSYRSTSNSGVTVGHIRRSVTSARLTDL
jgi:hypothetical protein